MQWSIRHDGHVDSGQSLAKLTIFILLAMLITFGEELVSTSHVSPVILE